MGLSYRESVLINRGFISLLLILEYRRYVRSKHFFFLAAIPLPIFSPQKSPRLRLPLASRRKDVYSFPGHTPSVNVQFPSSHQPPSLSLLLVRDSRGHRRVRSINSPNRVHIHRLALNHSLCCVFYFLFPFLFFFPTRVGPPP